MLTHPVFLTQQYNLCFADKINIIKQFSTRSIIDCVHICSVDINISFFLFVFYVHFVPLSLISCSRLFLPPFRYCGYIVFYLFRKVNIFYVIVQYFERLFYNQIFNLAIQCSCYALQRTYSRRYFPVFNHIQRAFTHTAHFR